MKKTKTLLIVLFGIITLSGCGFYSLTGAQTDAKTINISFFPNQASLIEPQLAIRFTPDLQELFTRQTNLTLSNSPNAELRLEGEIIDYRVAPMSATAGVQQTAAQNRLTITVNARFFNTLDEKDDFEKQFSFYSDFDASAQLTGGILESALDEILERITQDIFNAALGNW